MNITNLIFALCILALLPLHSRAQDTSPKTLQQWMDFLRVDASMDSVVNRIGQADKAKSVEGFAARAQMYVWFNRFENDVRKDNRLELVAAPDEEPDGTHMMVVALLDPKTGRGVYMPWAWRFVDAPPRGSYVPRNLMQAFIIN